MLGPMLKGTWMAPLVVALSVSCGDEDTSNRMAEADASADDADNDDSSDDSADDSADDASEDDVTDDIADNVSDDDAASDDDADDAIPGDAGADDELTDDTDGGTQLGARLKKQTYAAAGGAEVFVSLYDAQLEKPCSFQQTGEVNGEPVFHCLALKFTSIVFKDAGCTQPIVVTRPPCVELQPGDAVAGILHTGPGCLNETQYHLVGAETSAETVYGLVSGECSEQPGFAGRQYFELEELDLDQFVRGSVEVSAVDGTDDFAVETIVAEDGSSVFRNLRTTDGVCFETFMQNGDSLCLPDGRAFAGDYDYFQDAACMTPLASGSAEATRCDGSPQPEPKIVTYSEIIDSCSEVTKLFEVGQRVEPATVYNGGDVCSESFAFPLPALYELGTELPLDSVPNLTSVRTGDGRLRADGRGLAGGEPIKQSGSFFDTQTMQECTPVRDPNGVLRCFPVGRFTNPDMYFKDAACTQSLEAILTAGCNDPLAPGDIKRTSDFTTCTATLTAINELVPYAGPVYRQEDTCVVVPPDELTNQGYELAELGAEVPLDSFPELEFVTK